MDSSKHEVYAQYNIWKEDYKSALDNIEVIISKLKRESLKGYRGFCFTLVRIALIIYLKWRQVL